jgi:hypothetical protein
MAEFDTEIQLEILLLALLVVYVVCTYAPLLELVLYYY